MRHLKLNGSAAEIIDSKTKETVLKAFLVPGWYDVLDENFDSIFQVKMPAEVSIDTDFDIDNMIGPGEEDELCGCGRPATGYDGMCLRCWNKAQFG
jgi:hypothetical protein